MNLDFNPFQAARNYQDSVPRPKQRLPEVLQFPINDICNSRCQMCNIWQQKKDLEITPAQVKAVLSDPVFRQVKTVGINGGEPTLRRDLPEVAEAIIDSLPNLSGLSLITNAILAKRVINSIQSLTALCQARDVHLDVMVSLDGVGSVHDRVRGRPGNFESAVEVLDYLSSPDFVGSHRIGCTVIRENVYGVEELLDWCQIRGVYARFRIGVPHQRLYSDDVTEPFAMDEDEIYHFANFLDYLYHHYEPNETRRQFYRSLRNQLVYGAERKAGCAWKNKGATLSPRGELLYCAVQSKVLGNALETPAQQLYWENSNHLEDIVSNKCAGCLHDYEGISDRKVYVKQVLKKRADLLPPASRKLAGNVFRAFRTRQERTRIARALAPVENR